MSERSPPKTDSEALIEPFLEQAGQCPPTSVIAWSFLLSLLGGTSFFVPWWSALSVLLFAPAAVLVLGPATRKTADGFRRMARVALGVAASGVGLWLVAFASLLLRFRASAPELIGALLLVLLIEALTWGLLQR